MRDEAREVVSRELEGRIVDQDARMVEVTLIRAGRSENGNEYSPEVLMASVPLWEGCAAFCDHPSLLDAGRAGGRSVRDLVGVYEAARYEGDGVRAVLRFYPGGTQLFETVAKAIADREAGRRAPNIGISADMVLARAGGLSRRVVEIRRVNSADVVYRPSAGGRFDRVLEGGGVDVEPEAMANARQGKELELCGKLLDVSLAASKLGEVGKAQIRKRFAGRAFEAAELERAINDATELLADAASASVVRGAGAQTTAARLVSPRDKIEAGLERLFGLEPSIADAPRLTGIREAYIAITGDKWFDGRYHPEESVLEADEVTLSVMNDVVANVMNKRLVKDYRGQPKWWERIVVKVPIADMKLQTRILLNDFASLATVAELGPYVNTPWGDSKETYTPTKRGHMVQVTMEMIINDDVRAVTSIPKKLAIAAGITINEFVSGLFTANSGAGSTMADTNPVFHATRNNVTTGALDATALAAGILAIRKQANSAGKRLGLRPRYLLIPPDLEETAYTLTASRLKPGTANNDINFLEGRAEPLVVPNWTDTNNWYLMCDPTQIESIEIGFLNGREEPELLVQDSPTAGLVFTNDAISYKIRHIYGGGWLDYRGAYGAIVA